MNLKVRLVIKVFQAHLQGLAHFREHYLQLCTDVQSVSESNAISGAMRKELVEVFQRRIGPDEINICLCVGGI